MNIVIATALFSVNMHTLVKLQEFASALSPSDPQQVAPPDGPSRARSDGPATPTKESSFQLSRGSIDLASASPARARSATIAARAKVEPFGAVLRSQLSALSVQVMIRSVDLVVLGCRELHHPERGMFEIAR